MEYEFSIRNYTVFVPKFDVISKVFKIIFSRVQSFHGKSLFHTCFKGLWVIKNSFPIVTKLSKINTNKKAKSILTIGFTTLYTTIPHNLQIKVFSEFLIFFFKSKSHWFFRNISLLDICGRRYSTKYTSIDAISFLIIKCYFTVGNLVLKQEIGIPMGIPSSILDKLFIIFFKSKYVQ